ncbi:MAG: peptidyl-prolyl cis-trans isomerase [Lachnospiraceae bacterium]|nr:peptidyl-prolyl cis-trans isomerase [Lachnospiraceae bacterium]
MIASFLVCTFLLGGCGNQDLVSEQEEGEDASYHIVLTTEENEDEIFRIGDITCMKDQAQLYLTNMQGRYQEIFTDEIWQRDIDGQKLEDKLKDITLSRLVQVKTMVLMADDRQITLDEQDEQKIKAAAARYLQGGLPEGITDPEEAESSLEESYRELALADKVYQSIIQETEPEISDDEARMVTVSRILLRTSQGSNESDAFQKKQEVYQKALSLLARLNQGEDFDQVAAANNEADRITVSFGKGEMEEAVEKAAFELGKDQISNVIDTKEGYLILKCIQPFDREQTDLRKAKIARQRKEEGFLHIYEEFTKGQFRSFREEAWKDLKTGTDARSGGSNFFEIYQEIFGISEDVE